MQFLKIQGRRLHLILEYLHQRQELTLDLRLVLSVREDFAYWRAAIVVHKGLNAWVFGRIRACPYLRLGSGHMVECEWLDVELGAFLRLFTSFLILL